MPTVLWILSCKKTPVTTTVSKKTSRLWVAVKDRSRKLLMFWDLGSGVAWITLTCSFNFQFFERTIALLVAIGEMLETPFRVMDEFDVFVSCIWLSSFPPWRRFSRITATLLLYSWILWRGNWWSTLSLMSVKRWNTGNSFSLLHKMFRMLKVAVLLRFWKCARPRDAKLLVVTPREHSISRNNSNNGMILFLYFSFGIPSRGSCRRLSY